jgi:hypothetical protein
VPNYVALPALEYFVLEESWVVGIEVRAGIVEFIIDLMFAADHPELHRPRKGEYAYFRRGTIRFTGVSSLSWENMGVRPATDASGASDWGHIDAFDWLGTTYKLEGDFGVIELEASGLDVILTGPE